MFLVKHDTEHHSAALTYHRTSQKHHLIRQIFIGQLLSTPYQVNGWRLENHSDTGPTS